MTVSARLTIISVIFGAFLLSAPLTARAGEVTQIDLILDASGSMWGKIGGQTKIAIAKKALGGIIDELAKKEDLRVALRVYGHLNKKCSNSVLEVPMAVVDAKALKAKVDSLQPKGKTPIGYSITEAVKDFDKTLVGEKVIVLITDGLESCKADPCATALALKKAGIVTRMHVVGFGLNAKSLSSLKCIVKPSGGSLVGAGDAKQLTQAFKRIVKQTFNDNLVLTAKDDQGKDTLVAFEVYPAGKTNKPVAKGDTSLDHKGKASLAAGNYDVKVTHNGTGDVLWLRGLAVPEQGQVTREAVFAKRELRVKLRDPSGKFRYADVYLYDKAGKELKYADTSMGSTAHFTILPGIYDLKVVDNETKKSIWARDVDLTKEKTLEKIVPFK